MADVPDLEWLIAQLERRSPLAPQSKTLLAGLPIATREYQPNQYILREGDRPTACAFLRTGFVYRHKVVGEGGRQIVSVHVPGDFVDVQNLLLTHSDHNVQALTKSVVLTVPSGQLIEVATTNPTLGTALWRESLIEASIMREWIANVGRRDAYSRTAHLLCELTVRREAAGHSPRDTFDLPMTQEQFGDALGLTAVHVNRTLKTLEQRALIKRDKRSLKVIDWRGLADAGDFSTTYLHLPDND